MEALVYDDSPIAEVLEGDADPSDSENAAELSPTPATQYAPRGLPRLQNKLRSLRQTALSVTTSSGDRFLERFRYRIVASQLLSEDEKTKQHRVASLEELPAHVSLRGAASATSLSFAFAWVLHWLQSRLKSLPSARWPDLCLDICFVACLCGILGFVARKQYLKFTRQTAAIATSHLLLVSQELDEAIKKVLRYIQEIEVVARGYDLTNTLPPISRLHGDNARILCREYRKLAAKALYTGVTQFIHFHNELQPLANVDDLRTYYHIYELSPDDFSGAVSFANDMTPEAQETLKQLRFLCHLHSFARKFFLADLLALRTTAFWTDIQRWRKVARIVNTLTDDISATSKHLNTVLLEEEDSRVETDSDHDIIASPVQQHFITPERQQTRAQMRRFEATAQAVRALSARTRIGRDEIAELIARDVPDKAVNAAIVKQYEALGDDIRSLQDEWSRGRSIMTLASAPEERDNRPFSGMQTPLSPSPSLGGLTMVEGSPADALKVLNGEGVNDHGDAEGDDEIFEAVVQPRKRMSLGVPMSREEKIAKLKEDRQKRATLQEQTDNTTNMLRELQMVIKHRPQQRQPARITSI